MPYSGKTTVAKCLSRNLNYKFLDTDSIIEEENKSSISNIFNTRGEQYFRELERKLLQRLKKEEVDRSIIATGGGMPVYFNNMQVLKSMGITVFLDTPIDAIVERAKENKGRPLLTNDIENKIINMYQKRLEFYSQCHVAVRAENKIAAVTTASIMKKIEDFIEKNNNVCK